MKLALFLYNFTKIYILGAIFLCIIFSFPTHSLKEINLPTQSQPTVQKIDKKPVSVKNTIPPIPVEPSYVYIVEFKSGGSMKAKNVSIKNNIVTLLVDDGYSVNMSRNKIQKINKMRL